MEVAIKNWGNSKGIRIPKEVLERMHLKESDIMDIGIDGDAIVMRKKFTHKTFEQRLAEYDGQISVADFDWGEPVGREML